MTMPHNTGARCADIATLAAAMSGPLGDEAVRRLQERERDTIRLVRCPEVEEVGALPDPVTMHGEYALVTYALDGIEQVYTMPARSMAAYKYRTVVRWCLASDLARDPATTVWHERTVRRVRRWTLDAMPPVGQWFVRMEQDGYPVTGRFDSDRERNRLLSFWNEHVLGYAVLPTLTPDADGAA